jgi:hypothetical protein
MNSFWGGFAAACVALGPWVWAMYQRGWNVGANFVLDSQKGTKP